jgi:hypothetical protein
MITGRLEVLVPKKIDSSLRFSPFRMTKGWLSQRSQLGTWNPELGTN